MALTYITYKCGHEDRIQIYGTNVHGERDRKAAWYNTVYCPECGRARAAAWCADHGCATLKGSDKQIAWAERIRANCIRGMEIEYKELEDRNPCDAALENAKSVIAMAKGMEQAVWWIDNRDDIGIRRATGRVRDAGEDF